MRTAARRGGPREQVNTVCETTEGRPGLTRGRTQFWGRMTKGEREREREKTSEGVERGRMYAARRGCEGEREKD